MKYKLSAVAAFVSLTAIISCAGNDDKDYIDKSLISPSAENKTAQPAVTNTAANETTNTIPNATTVAPATNTINLNPQTNAVNLNTQNVTSNTQQPQQLTARGMNPPHGQPNHRCDIAVGAPLNSKPAPINTAPTTVSTTQPAPVAINTQQTKQVTAPGMNPPHGQPNHRCDIAVGAPLNSKPAPTNTTPTTVSTTQPAPVATNTQQTQQVTAPGMNPPHGQPNHRCDIAVGAPLNSPPGPTATPAQTIAIPAKKDSAKN